MPPLQPRSLPRRIAAAVDFSNADAAVLSHAVSFARVAGRGALVLLFHVVESGALGFWVRSTVVKRQTVGESWR
jgi:hypothetical protein